MGKTIPEAERQRILDGYEHERQKLGIDYGYCFCGCGEKAPVAQKTATKDQVVRGFPKRYVYHHRVRTLKTKPVKYRVEGRGYDTPCWVWLLKVADNGYGHITVGGKTKLAHRHMYEQHVGPIPAGATLDHLCAPSGGPRSCVRPDHLEPVPIHINQRRGSKTILSMEVVEAVRQAHADGVNLPALEALIGIKRRTLRAAIHGENWAK